MERQELGKIIANKILEHAIASVDVENDYLYKRGFKKGRAILKKQIRGEENETSKNRFFSIEGDYFYKKGYEKGKEIALKQIIDEEIEKTNKKYIIGAFKADIDVKTIAKVLRISQKKVKQVIKESKKTS